MFFICTVNKSLISGQLNFLNVCHPLLVCCLVTTILDNVTMLHTKHVILPRNVNRSAKFGMVCCSNTHYYVTTYLVQTVNRFWARLYHKIISCTCKCINFTYKHVRKNSQNTYRNKQNTRVTARTTRHTRQENIILKF